MGVFAKVIAGVVLIGSALGLAMSAMGFVTLARVGALDGMLEQGGVAAASYFGRLGFSVFISISTIVLAILVLGAPPPPSRSV